MTKIVRQFALCAVCLAALLLPNSSVAETPNISSETSVPTYWQPFVGGDPQDYINGIYYELSTRLINFFQEYPTLPRLEFFGFILNLDDTDTYHTADGLIIPAFDSALKVIPPNKYGLAPEGAPSSYSGELYLPDMEEIVSHKTKYYVLHFAPNAMAEGLTALRTALYMTVMSESLEYAINLLKAQIGTCFVVEPNAFKNCSKLETVIFERDPYVYNNAFTDCPNLKTIVLLYDKRLPMLESASSFAENVYSTAMLYVPDALMDDCVNDPVWSKFVHIKSLKDSPVELMKPQL